jgi:alpha-tubulin suppressor-like RCC1 family protein
VACHTLALSENSEVFSWGAGGPRRKHANCSLSLTRGAGEYGKLGLGDEEQHTSPVLVEELQVGCAPAVEDALPTRAQGKGVRAVACGGFHSVALSDTGSVYCWGGGDKGQLGLGNDKSQTLPCVVDTLQVPCQIENNTVSPYHIHQL